MKSNHKFYVSVSLFLILTFLFSCAGIKKRRYTSGYYIYSHHNTEKKNSKDSETTVNDVIQQKENVSNNEIQIEDSEALSASSQNIVAPFNLINVNVQTISRNFNKHLYFKNSNHSSADMKDIKKSKSWNKLKSVFKKLIPRSVEEPTKDASRKFKFLSWYNLASILTYAIGILTLDIFNPIGSVFLMIAALFTLFGNFHFQNAAWLNIYLMISGLLILPNFDFLGIMFILVATLLAILDLILDKKRRSLPVLNDDTVNQKATAPKSAWLNLLVIATACTLVLLFLLLLLAYGA